MLYIDSSAFVKFYFKERGSTAVLVRVKSANQTVAASLLTFAEVHAAIARKRREKLLSFAACGHLRDQFEQDWSNLVEVIDVNPRTMALLPKLVEAFPLKASDAIQLSTALWLGDWLKTELGQAGEGALEFAAVDRTLTDAARKCGLKVFNPEEDA